MLAWLALFLPFCRLPRLDRSQLRHICIFTLLLQLLRHCATAASWGGGSADVAADCWSGPGTHPKLVLLPLLLRQRPLSNPLALSAGTTTTTTAATAVTGATGPLPPKRATWAWLTVADAAACIRTSTSTSTSTSTGVDAILLVLVQLRREGAC